MNKRISPRNASGRKLYLALLRWFPERKNRLVSSAWECAFARMSILGHIYIKVRWDEYFNRTLKSFRQSVTVRGTRWFSLWGAHLSRNYQELFWNCFCALRGLQGFRCLYKKFTVLHFSKRHEGTCGNKFSSELRWKRTLKISEFSTDWI